MGADEEYKSKVQMNIQPQKRLPSTNFKVIWKFFNENSLASTTLHKVFCQLNNILSNHSIL